MQSRKIYDQHRMPLKKDEISQTVLNYEFDILSFNDWQQREIAATPALVLDCYKLIIVEKGMIYLHFHHKDIYADEFDCVLIPPYTVYSAQCIGHQKVSFYFFDFQLNLKKRHILQDTLNLTEPFLVSDILHENTMVFLKQALQDVKEQRDGSYFSVMLSLKRFFIEIYKRFLSSSSIHSHLLSSHDEQIIYQCLHYFAIHLSSPIKVQELCTHLHVSQSYLYQCFQRTFHMSVQQAILDYKLKQSLTLLSQPYTIQEVATACGFLSVHHFSKTFKEKFGLSPLKFKNNYFLKSY